MSRLSNWLSGASAPDARQPPQGEDYLDQPLLSFDEDEDPWTIRHARNGTHIFGAPGSGKTTGSGETIAKAFLNAGFGGLVMTAKSDEPPLWDRYARETGREQDLIIFSPDDPWTFDFLDYELNREGPGAGFTRNIVDLFFNILDITQRGGNDKEDPTWRTGLNTLLTRLIDLCATARDTVSVQELFDIVRTAIPKSGETLEVWQARSTCWQYLLEGQKKAKQKGKEANFQQTYAYWSEDFPNMPDKMRQSIVGMFTNLADTFMTDPVRQLFCTTDQPITPDMTHEGKIIILDLPVEEFGEVGLFCQALFKYVWQRATQRRVAVPDSLPCFLWADEAQYFITENDMMFQPTARSKNACTVYLTQNISAYYARLGDGRGKATADALIANFGTLIWHANTDPITNTLAADTIAQDVLMRRNFGGGAGEGGPRGDFGAAEVVDYVVMPIEFTTLRMGGRDNDWNVDAIIMQSGKTWKQTGHTCLKTTFKQSLREKGDGPT